MQNINLFTFKTPGQEDNPGAIIMKQDIDRITDGVATFNADPFNILDNIESFREAIGNAHEIIEHTREDTDEYNWGVMLSKLDLCDAKSVSRIYETRENGACVMLFASDEDYTFD